MEAAQLELVREAFRMGQELTVQAQHRCNHTKGYKNFNDLRPAVVGTALWSGDKVFVCQRCFKEWESDALPEHLTPHPITIGKPLGIE